MGMWWNIWAKVATVFLVVVTLLLFYISFSNYRSNQAYLHSERVKTEAVIKEDEQGVKTYNFSGNPYGVTNSANWIRNKDIGKDGEKVTIYYQKDKPWVVYTEKNPKLIWLNWAGPLFSGFGMIAVMLLSRWIVPKLMRRWGLSK